MTKPISRRVFIKGAAILTGGALLSQMAPRPLRAAFHRGASLQGPAPSIYLGQWEWIDDGEFQYWQAPGGNAIDHFELRNWSEMGTKGPTERGYAIFVYASPQTHPNLHQYLGDSLTGLVKADTKQALATELGLGEAIIGSTMLGILLELLNQHADPTGQTRWKPIRGSQVSGFKFTVKGFGQVINERFDETHPFWAPTLAIWQADYRRNRAEIAAELLFLESQLQLGLKTSEEVEEVRASRSDMLQGFTGASMHKYRVGADVLLPSEYITDGWRQPRSIVNDDFNRPNEDPLTGWDEVEGITWQIISNEVFVDEVSSTFPSSIRFQTAVDSDDHEVEVTYTAGGSANSLLGPTLRYAAAAKTFYYGLIRSGGSLRELTKVITGTETPLASDTSGSGPPQLIRIRINSDDLLQLFDDDVLALFKSNETSITGNLRGGIAAHSSNDATGDNWSLTDLAAPAARRIIFIS